MRYLVSLFGLMTIYICTIERAFAQTFSAPVGTMGEGRKQFDGFFANSHVDYKIHGFIYDGERKALGATVSDGISPSVDIFGMLAILPDSSINGDGGDTDEGKGFALGGGSRFAITNVGKAQFYGDAGITYMSETFEK